MVFRPAVKDGVGSSYRPLFQMLLQPRHQLDEIAGLVAAVQLEFQDAVPGILAGAGGAGHGENIGALGDAAAGA